eukprot:1155698-Pelagomonas_calceolata.AAC.2
MLEMHRGCLICKIVSTRTIENKNASHSQVLAPGASVFLPPPSKSPLAFSGLSLVVEGTYGSFEPRGRRAGQPLGAWRNFIFLWRTYPPGSPLELRGVPWKTLINPPPREPPGWRALKLGLQGAG